MIHQMVQSIDLKKLKVEKFEEKYAKDILNIYFESYRKIYRCRYSEDVIKIEKSIYGESYSYLNEENLLNSIKKGLNILVCLYNNKIIAFVSFWFWDKKTVYIDEFHVKKDYRGLGIGSWFLRKLEEILRSKGVRKIILDSYIKSVEFFHKQGYRPTGKRFGEYVRLKKLIDFTT